MKTDEARVLIEAVPSSVVEEEREVGVMDEILKADPKFTSLNIGFVVGRPNASWH